jgi:murein DD-endopeptidase MepM/ murein hydrolase activator NlpD
MLFMQASTCVPGMIPISSAYGHLSQIFVARGDSITAGQPIGITGATGRVTGEHLHFSISYHNLYIDPMDFLYQNLINNNHE